MDVQVKVEDDDLFAATFSPAKSPQPASRNQSPAPLTNSKPKQPQNQAETDPSLLQILEINLEMIKVATNIKDLAAKISTADEDNDRWESQEGNAKYIRYLFYIER
ncbi:hypothetical protein N7471_008667 [Penicillium samsonianum]|uniref:uncharacterized protein n=1 Tax=Penicillium samsonianum TaxID=1882272 RepID=UPI002548EA86|nr:uncharacterized protein N7471_008667 [Penicillium samsonianum]KAJ6133452.1 hypothetical protein N7471_008667 [Penicillium samsonianum]